MFANNFHSAALRGKGYLTYLNHTRKENWTSREAVHFDVFYIASLWWCTVHWCKETYLIYREGKHICLLVYYWGLCCEILQLNFSQRYYSNVTWNGCVFEPVSFGVVMGNNHWKSQISSVTQNLRSRKPCGHSSMKIFPLHLWQERSFQCNGEDTKFRFEWLIPCLQTRKKGVKRLVRGRNTSILGQNLWKQTEPISLIFNRPETVKSYISTSQ